MSDRLLICVDASAAGLAAARVAIDMLSSHGGRARALFVAGDDTSSRLQDGDVVDEDSTESQIGHAGEALLARVRDMAEPEDLEVETRLLFGDPLRLILDEAERWRPDLILMGRGRRRGPGSPVVGSLTAHVLEFTRWPVVVVPAELDRDYRRPS